MLRRNRNDALQYVEQLVRANDVDGLTSLLQDPNARGAETHVAVETLVDMDTPEAWDAICAVVVDSANAAVKLVIDRLAEIDSNGAVRALGECLSNRDDFIRIDAVRALEKKPSTSAVMAHLLRAARDPRSSIARLAARVILRRIEEKPTLLGKIRAVTAEGIFELLDDRWAMEMLAECYPENIRVMAAHRLGTIGGEEATQALASIVTQAVGKLADECWRSLEQCHAVSDFILLPLLVHKNPEIKARAIGIYAKFATPDARDILDGLARDPDSRVRSAALRALTRLVGVGAIPSLAQALEDEREEVRILAVQLLSSIPDTEAELVQAVRSGKGEVRRKALVCLANRGVITGDLVFPYVEMLFQGASCTDLSQRAYLDSLAVVARTLGEACNPEALLALTALARSVIRRMRRAAIEGIMCYPHDMRSDALFALMDCYDPDVLRNVAMGLHEAQDRRAVIPLVRMLHECRGRPMLRAKEALKEYRQVEDIDFLIRCLSEKWASVRRFGAERLKEIRDEKAIPALLEASRDEDVEVQLAVFEAMGPFASERDDVRERMLEAIRFGDISVRQTACEALGEARCKEAVPHLIKALANCFLRPRATEALRRIGDRKGYLALKRLEIREKLFPKKPKEALERENARRNVI